MAMKENLWEGVVVLSLKGKFIGGSESLAIHDKVHSLLADGSKQVVLDLSDAEWFNSSGLGIIIACTTSLRNAGGDLKLANVRKKVEILLQATKLIYVFSIYGSVQKAVDSFL